VTRFVVDASIVLNWCFPDENAPLARTVAQMFKQGDTAIAPAFWPHEVLNALLVGERRKRISRALVGTFLADLATLPVQLELLPADEVFGQIEEISRGYGLTPYDAAYLQLAGVAGLPLATLDGDLIEACKRSGVTLV
jgi:predicted nucleic acid-binding protein